MNLPNMQDAKKRTNEEVKTINVNNIVSDKFKDKLFYLKTYGCQMNVHDSEEIKQIVINLGFKETLDYEKADLIILNTCAIRENAHDKVFGFLGRVKHLKKENPELIVAVGGCMPQQESVAQTLKDKYPFVNIVFGTHNIQDLGSMILKENKKQEIDVYSIEGNIMKIFNMKEILNM